MKSFEVQVEGRVSFNFQVEAEDKIDAERKAEDYVFMNDAEFVEITWIDIQDLGGDDADF